VSEPARLLPRRTFLVQVGWGTAAFAVLGVAAACSPAASPAASRSPTPSRALSPSPTGSPEPSPSPQPVTWRRVDVGIVSAYVLAREGEAALVDTGVAGSADAIEAGLQALDFGWGDVGHVILTHLHPDHVGSLSEVLDRATGAVAYAGAPDIDSIPSPRPLTEVGDGDEVFGLRVVATPGHTPGHISVLDPVGGILVAGDAVNTEGGKVTGPNPQFSVDMDTANASVKTLAGLQFGTLLVGHGDPIEKDASKQVAALASALK
jgi:glyoxylase-like metal-dependent hydrolase (beta-lactamase superfamily II)